MEMHEILERRIIFDQTPTKVGAHIRSFCRKIQPAAEPIYLDMTPDDGALPRECYENVEKRCLKRGGVLQYGWAIWTWPHIWLKAEHHAVWKDESGTLVDITPNTPECTRLLFLPDSSQSHDPTRATRIDNIVHPLVSDPSIAAIGKAERTILDYEDAHTEPGTRIVRANAERYEYLQVAKDVAIFRVMTKYIRTSEPCLCRSGLKFRDCHLGLCNMVLQQWDDKFGRAQ